MFSLAKIMILSSLYMSQNTQSISDYDTFNCILIEHEDGSLESLEQFKLSLDRYSLMNVESDFEFRGRKNPGRGIIYMLE